MYIMYVWKASAAAVDIDMGIYKLYNMISLRAGLSVNVNSLSNDEPNRIQTTIKGIKTFSLSI